MLQLINSLPGRARFKAAPLHYNEKLSKYLHAYIDNLFGVKSSSTNYYTATILVEFDERKTSIHTLKENILNAITAVPDSNSSELDKYEKYNVILEKRDRAKINFVIFGLLYIALKIKIALFGKFILSSNLRVLQAASIVTVIGGYPAVKKTFKFLGKYIPADFEILLKTASVSFTLIRESTKGILLLTLKELNDYIKLSADAENWRLLNQTIQKNTGMAWLILSDNQETLVPLGSLQPGDAICVHKGEIIPANGKVFEGEGVSNSLYFTGQPIIDHIYKGSKVFEGMSLISGELKVKVAEIPVTHYKQDISMDKLYLQKRVEIYQKNITKVSLTSASISYLLSNNTLKSLSTLLVMTPSATGTALTSGIKSYISVLNKNKIFLRNPNTFESITQVKRIVFDKTGTLTHGNMQIEGMESFDKDYTESQLLKISAACEANYHHPISNSIKAEAGANTESRKVGSTAYIPAKGIEADYEGRKVIIGNKLLMEENNIDIRKGLRSYKKFEQQLCTPVFISIDGKLTGIIALKEKLREGSFELIRKLKEIGISRISLITGDTSERAEYIASELGINDVQSGCSLNDKVNFIEEAKKYGKVMMVGDGINDIPAMVSADISLSYVDSSCDKAKLHSDCIILEDRMLKLADLFSLSRNSFSMINQSITASELFNCTFGVIGSIGNIDTFAAKSLNTTNSLMALLLNKRIEYLGVSRGRFF